MPLSLSSVDAIARKPWAVISSLAYLLEELAHLGSLRDAIHAEMVAAGQVAPDVEP